jgi:Phage integrase family
MAELPKVRKSKTLRFLDHDELERIVSTPLPESDQELVAAFPPSRKKDRPSEFGGPQPVRDWWPVLRLLILIAAMTGMRPGELRALRWSDFDYRAMKIRVRREYVRGQYDNAKSLGSERGIPLAARLVTELDEHHQRTVWNQDSDLVPAHPHRLDTRPPRKARSRSRPSPRRGGRARKAARRRVRGSQQRRVGVRLEPSPTLSTAAARPMSADPAATSSGARARTRPRRPHHDCRCRASLPATVKRPRPRVHRSTSTSVSTTPGPPRARRLPFMRSKPAPLASALAGPRRRVVTRQGLTRRRMRGRPIARSVRRFA